MKKLIAALTIAMTGMGASAQDLSGTSIYDRIGHGEDSISVLGSLSLYQEAFKEQNWAEAVEPWEFVFNKAPLAMVRVYTDGAWMFELIRHTKDNVNKRQYRLPQSIRLLQLQPCHAS